MRVFIQAILAIFISGFGSVLQSRSNPNQTDFPHADILWNVKSYTDADSSVQPCKSLAEIYFLQSSAALDYRTNYNSNRRFYHNYGDDPERELNRLEKKVEEFPWKLEEKTMMVVAKELKSRHSNCIDLHELVKVHEKL